MTSSHPDASAIFAELGAPLWAERAAKELSRARPRPRRDRELTSAERQAVEERFVSGDARVLLATDAASEGVNLLTYHRAKGLEWDAVFLPALEEGLLPIRQAKEPDAIDEERFQLLSRALDQVRRALDRQREVQRKRVLKAAKS